MTKIKSITEAFSQQPHYQEVVKVRNSAQSCARIEVESRRVDSDKECGVYVGYNFEDKEIFCYLQSSVNVHYDPTTV